MAGLADASTPTAASIERRADTGAGAARAGALRVRMTGGDPLGERVADVLEAVEAPVERGPAAPAAPDDDDETRRWARSGAMGLCGFADEAPLSSPAPIASAMDAAANALQRIAGAVPGLRATPLDGPALLGERAVLSEPALSRHGRTAPGGSCRLLATRDRWLVLNLAREDDRALLPAWLETPVDTDRWESIAQAVGERSGSALAERAAWMGLPANVVPDEPCVDAPAPWLRIERLDAVGPEPTRAPIALDLSALWAGPLCGQLLARAGARVVKLESLERPDGARTGPARFFDLMNADKQSVAVGVATDRGRALLRALIARADIVIESSRPRALEQLGIHAREEIGRHPGLTWISITGYGRGGAAADRVAFGDDAAAAAGLVARDASGAPLFCGDAIADPLCGLHAACAALAGFLDGGGRLIDVSLFGVAAHVARLPRGAHAASAPAPAPIDVLPPRAREASGRAAAPGADNRRVFDELGIRC